MKKTNIFRNKLQYAANALLELKGNIVKCDVKPPHSFDLYHELGSREFTMYAENVNGAIVLIHCNVSNKSLRPIGGGAKKKIIKPIKMRSRIRCQNSTPETSPVEFSAFLNLPLSGLTLEASCSCALGLLVVDGIVIHDGCITDWLIPRDGNSAREMLYQGPLLNQRFLSESIINVRSCVNPLDSYRQEQAFFFDGHVRPWSSGFRRFGHLPVHTVNPHFADILCRFLENFNIDDDLANFVEKYAHEVQEKEKKTWSILLKNFTERNRVL